MTDYLKKLLQTNKQRSLIAVPYLWLVVFFLVPLLIIVKISISEQALGRPPYADLWQLIDGGIIKLQVTFENFLLVFEDELYGLSYLYSLKMATISTLLCLLLGYPMAYCINRCSPKVQIPLLMLIVLPFWTSFLLRVYAWLGLLKSNGIINSLLMSLGIVSEPQTLLQTDWAIYIGMTYSYLPFMIMPIYVSLQKQDKQLLEAAADLGSMPLATFLQVTLPLSISGVITGSLLVFIPAMGEYVIPELLGGTDNLMIGRVIWGEFFHNRDWPVASALAIITLILLIVPILFLQNLEDRYAQRMGGE